MRPAALALVFVALAACPPPTPAPTGPPKVTVTPPPTPPDAPVSTITVEEPVPRLRLPRAFTPTSYVARLAIDPAKPTFTGAIEITGELHQQTSVVWLHGRHLAVKHATASRGDAPALLTVTPRAEDLLELHADAPLDPGTWKLALEYSGEVDEINTTGAFKETVAGNAYVYSQFEAIYARRVFPCLDEPDSKVPWQLTLDVPKGQLAVSNTPVAEETALADGGKRFVFAPTKPLPAYLVAFGVGPFDVVPAGQTKSGVPVRMIVMKGRAADAAYAAKTTARILDLLEEWFGIPYPYPKLDMLAIPLTAGFGAMENAGLVTAAERHLLIDPQHPSWDRRRGWIYTASHELAHQWFGDLVTTAWWDDIWLNEGFATWLQGKIAARFEPAWHEEAGEIGERFGALEADALVNARRIRQPIDSTSDILNVFDGITYAKGASILDMFETYVGAETFQRGVREYLKGRAFGNATSADFVAAISKVANKDLAPAFGTFLEQSGAPELAFTVTCSGAPRIELAQQRYVPAGSPAPAATKPWIVPVCVAYDKAGKRAESCTLLDGATGAIALDTKTCPRWVMPNVGGRGYYRTALAAAQATALRDEAWPQLTWPERRAVAYDVLTAVQAGKLPLLLSLSLVPKLLGGDRFTIDDAVAVPRMLERFVADDQRGKYEAWVRMTFGPGAAKVGLVPKDSDDADTEESRRQLFDLAAWHGRDPELVKQAVEAAAHWRELPAAIRGPVLAVAADASAEVFDHLRAEVRAEPDRARRSELVNALESVRDPKRYEAALALALDPALDFRETERIVFGPSTDATRALAQAYFKAHRDELEKRLPHDEVSGALGGAVGVFTATCDAARRDEIATYVTETFAHEAGGERTVKIAIEGMDQCIARRKLLDPEIRGWLGGVKIPRPPAQKKK